MADYENTLSELKNMAGQQVIPGKYLAQQDTGAALMTGIAVVAGLYGQNLTGSNTNIGMDMITKAIDKDVELQKYDIDRRTHLKQKELEVKDSLFSKMRPTWNVLRKLRDY